MICPKCKLENPDEAMRCDCGYDFEHQEIKESYLNLDYRTPKKSHIILAWFFSFLGGWIGLYLSYNLAFKKERGYYVYDEATRKKGKIMFAIAVISAILSLIIGNNIALISTLQ